MPNPKKEAEAKLMKGLLDFIVLQLLNTQQMHGYQIITKIRKSYGVYFGPSTIYPLLSALQKKGFVIGQWSTDTERPRKIYQLTKEGQTVLSFTEDSFNLICHKIATTAADQDVEIGPTNTLNPLKHRL